MTELLVSALEPGTVLAEMKRKRTSFALRGSQFGQLKAAGVADPVLDQIQARPYALMVCAGSDGAQAVRQVERIATGWRLRRVAEPLVVCTRAQTPQAIQAPKAIDAAALRACEDLGEALASGLALGVF